MKKSTKIIFVAALSCIAMGAGVFCGCNTNLGEHVDTYFSGINKVFEDSAEYKRVLEEVSSGTSTKNENQLDKPANFVVEDGKYSFDGVENAASYEIAVYESSGSLDARGTKTIAAGDSSTYTGDITDIAANLSYGEWYFRVTAIPAADSGLEESKAASTTYIKKGEVTNGNITTTYIWNACSGDITLNLNGLNYESTSYPTNITVTLKNTSTNATYTAETGKVSSSSTSVDVELPQSDATYSIALDCTWNEEYVTNPTWSTTADNITLKGKVSSISDGLSYSSDIFNSFDFPFVYENFAVNNVSTKAYAEVTNDEGVEFGKYGNDVSFKAYPLWTEKDYTAKTGAVKSFDVRIKGSGSITASPKKSPGSGSTNMIFGQLDFYSDGTFELELEYQYMKTDGMNDAIYYVPGIICEGIYVENSDGTYTLSFDYANAYETDYEPVQELTGRASYYSEIDSSWNSSSSGNQGGGDQGGGGGGDVSGWTISAPSTPTTFEKGATSIVLDFNITSTFTGTLAATASEGSTYTYNTKLTDTGAPFDSTSSLELKSDGTAVWCLPNEDGPLKATELKGTWTTAEGQIVITWTK